MRPTEQCGKERFFHRGIRAEICSLPLGHEGRHDPGPPKPDPHDLFVELLRICNEALGDCTYTMPDGETRIVDAVRKALSEHAE